MKPLQKQKPKISRFFFLLGTVDFLILRTCHWCHVMEKESFEDQEVARALNNNFIAVKVDKEERPDIDSVYMGVCQALTGSGGWPLTVLMTPEQKPFFAGTYFPKHRRYGHPGLLELLSAVSNQWLSDRDSLVASGDKITGALAGEQREPSGQPPGRGPVEQAARQLAKSFDSRYGGFGGPPKFPSPHNLLFLLRCHQLGVEKNALEMVEHTLVQMYKGGIFDHLGGGFSRYSTDEKWLAPHFEKMLYDNALLVMALLECLQITQNPLYKVVVRKTLDYVGREMTSPEGAFYSAQDADSDGEEGKYYTFDPNEAVQLLGVEDGKKICGRYDITSEGNFEGKCIPNLIRHGSAELPDPHMEQLLEKLREYRSNRFALHKDDKILTAWNALMIAAYAKAYRTLGDPADLESAVKAYGFLQRHMTGDGGSLAVSYRNGATRGEGVLDDYAFLAWACLELYESTFDPQYLKRAGELMETVISRFPVPTGGFYLTPDHGEHLIFRPLEQFDGAMPSGNSVAAWCLARLAALTGENRWRDATDRQLRFYGEMFTRQPTACTFALTALMQAVYPSRELVCVLPDAVARDCIAKELGPLFHPQTAVLAKSAEIHEALAEIAPFTVAYVPSRDHESAFYLCQNQSCSAPVFDLALIEEQLL